MKRNVFQRVAQTGDLIMRCTCSHSLRAQLLGAAFAFLACNGAAWAQADIYDPATGVLTADNVTLGGALFTNMQVTVSGIASGPTSPPAKGDWYSYDTASNQMTVPFVDVGNFRYFNVVATVGSLVSPGTVIGADVYDGAHLTIPYVQVLGTDNVYANVVSTVGSIVRVDRGMPKVARDVYDPGTAQLTIGAVQYGSNVYTNVVVTVNTIASVGSSNPPPTLGPSILHFSCRFFPYCTFTSAQLINTGTRALNIGSIVLNSPLDSGYPVFSEDDDCHASVGPGQSCAIELSLNGDVPPYQATLTVTDDGVGSPQVLTLLNY
jgi:hypothetical protein